MQPRLQTNRIRQGISLYVVQGLLGHAHSRTTQRYAHLAQQTLREAAEVVGTIVGGDSRNGPPERSHFGSRSALSGETRLDLAHTEVESETNPADGA